MLKKNILVKSKIGAGEFGLQKVIVLLLAILVLVAVFIFLTKPQILDWLRNQPGYSPVADNESQLTCDQLKLLKYEKIGNIFYEERGGDLTKHSYVDFENDIKVNLEDCDKFKGTKKGACFVNDCPNLIIAQTACAGAGGIWQSGCFDSQGKTMIDKTYIKTRIYLDYDISGGETGTLKIVRNILHSNTEVGTMSGGRIELTITQDQFEQLKSIMAVDGYSIDYPNFQKLDKAKYISGDI